MACCYHYVAGDKDWEGNGGTNLNRGKDRKQITVQRSSARENFFLIIGEIHNAVGKREKEINNSVLSTT